MTQTIKYLYDFDRTGVSKNNRIYDEKHTITPYTPGEFRYIVPRCAPFFTMNYEVYLIEAGTNNKVKLERYVHYAESHPYKEITNCLQKQVCGSIMILDKSLTGTISVVYNCLGGPFTIDSAKILEIMANRVVNPITVDWSSVANVPDKFPPEAHYHPAENLGEFSKLVEAIKQNTDAMVNEFDTNSTVLAKHLTDNNPHGITLDKLGIPHLRNTHIATDAEIEAGSNMLAIVTAAGLGYFKRHLNATGGGGGGSATDIAIDSLKKEFKDFKNSINKLQNYGVATNDNELVETANNLYARVSDVYKIIRKFYATNEQGLNPTILDKLITPSVLHAVLNEFMPIGAMFYLPRAHVKSSRCVIPNGAKFNTAVYPELYNYLGTDYLPGSNGLYIKNYNPGGMSVNDVGKVYEGTGVLKDVNGNVTINTQQSGGLGAHFHVMDSVMVRTNGSTEKISFGSKQYYALNAQNVAPWQSSVSRVYAKTSEIRQEIGKTPDGRLEDLVPVPPGNGTAQPLKNCTIGVTSLPILNSANNDIKVINSDGNTNTTTTANLNLNKQWTAVDPWHIILNLVMRAK